MSKGQKKILTTLIMVVLMMILQGPLIGPIQSSTLQIAGSGVLAGGCYLIGYLVARFFNWMFSPSE